MVVYHLQKVSRKSGWKENGTRIIGVPAENFREQRKIWKGVVLFPRSEQSKRKFAFLFFAVIFDTSYRPSRPLFGKKICTNSKRDYRTKFTSPKFFLPYSQTLTDRFADVNGKQNWWLFSFAETVDIIVAWYMLKLQSHTHHGENTNWKNLIPRIVANCGTACRFLVTVRTKMC